MPPSEFFRQRARMLATRPERPERRRARPAVQGDDDIRISETRGERLLRLTAALIVTVYLFRLALVLKLGVAGYSALFSSLRDSGAPGAFLARLCMPDRLTLTVVDLIRPLF